MLLSVLSRWFITGLNLRCVTSFSGDSSVSLHVVGGKSNSICDMNILCKVFFTAAHSNTVLMPPWTQHNGVMTSRACSHGIDTFKSRVHHKGCVNRIQQHCLKVTDLWPPVAECRYCQSARRVSFERQTLLDRDDDVRTTSSSSYLWSLMF